MEPRIHRSNMPVYLREDIEPMEDVSGEFNGRYRLVTWAMCALITAIFWYAVAKAVGL